MRGKKKSTAKSNPSRQAGHIRVISGQWRGRKLPVADVAGLRPTTDRTKETLFNWLMQDISGARCLDLFAGAGSLGIEALSRYARCAFFVEKHLGAFENLRAIRQTLRLDTEMMSIINADALLWLDGMKHQGNSDNPESATNPDQLQFDIVFIDPPFHQNLVTPAMERLAANDLLTENALIYVEHEVALDWCPPDTFVEVKYKSTQQVVSRLLQFSETGI